jgi:hypothetical protein
MPRLWVPDVIRAHIVPAAFGRMAIGDGKHLKQISRASRRPLNSGIYDDGIVCGPCDAILGHLRSKRVR